MQLPVNEERNKGVILQRKFSNIEQLAKHLQPLAKVQVTQLSVERLQCDLSLIGFDEVQFAFFKSSCPIFHVGEKSRDARYFCCILETSGPCVVSHNRKISHDTLGGFDCNLEARFVLPPSMLFVVVQIKLDVLQHFLEVMERPDLDERFWASNFAHIPETIATVKTYLQQLPYLIQHQPHFLQQSDTKKLLIDDFIPLLINAIPPVTKNQLQRPSLLKRARLANEAEDYIMAHLTQPLTLKSLCQALHTSATPMFTGFREVYGISPMEYLKVQRLLSVRRSLQAADPETTSVKTIAQQFGFWSAGHFARDYKQMFGELPSETLKG